MLLFKEFRFEMCYNSFSGKNKLHASFNNHYVMGIDMARGVSL